MILSPIAVGLLLSLLAGSATTLGALLALLVKKNNFRILALGLGFSAGVMIDISLLELLGGSINHVGFLAANLAFFAGIAFIFLIDIFVPHEYIAECLPTEQNPQLKKLAKAGVMTAAGIAIHNVIEGVAVFTGAVHSFRAGILLATAIAVHNIPEGISVSLPIFYATNNRKKAFWLSFFSGLTEPLGALISALLLWPFLTPGFINLLLAFVAGIMLYISFDELLPAAHKYGEEHLVTLGIVLGIFLMSTTLFLLR